MLKKAKKYSSLLTAVYAILFLGLAPAFAQMQLQISNVSVTNVTDTSTTIRWTTNIPGSARVDFGIDENYGTYLTAIDTQRTSQEFVIRGLSPETTYHFKITARGGGQEISTFDRTFKTAVYVDRITPIISNVHIAYVTATSATIQWDTDEPATSGVRYGTTVAYGGNAGYGGLRKNHDVTIGWLSPGTFYHFQVVSMDNAQNSAVYSDLTFTTLYNTESEKVPLAITDVRPLTPNDTQLGIDTATITWTTNKLASGIVYYGTSAWFGASALHTSPYREFAHKAVLKDLQPGTKYYFILESWDVFNAAVRSDTFTFTTKKAPVVSTTVETVERPVLVLGFSTVAATPASALYRVKGQTDVYAIIAKKRYRLTGPISLYRYASGLAVQEVSQETLESFPLVRLVKATEGDAVYHLYRRPNNKILKLAIPSPTAFTSYPANRWDAIITVEPEELAQYSTAVLVRAKGDSVVYLLDGTTKRPFVSEQALRSRGYSLSDIVEISTTHLGYYQTGAVLN